MTKLWPLILIMFVVQALTLVQTIDNTIKPRAKGFDVAKAALKKVINRCVFHKPNLFRFMIRMCWVEGHCGDDSDSFSADLKNTTGRGIWRISEKIFKEIREKARNNTDIEMRPIIENMKIKLGLDVRNMTGRPEELDPPVNNALIIAMYLTTLPHQIPASIHEQAKFWAHVIKNNLTLISHFLDRVATIPKPLRPPVDLLISIDGSSQPFLQGPQFIHFVQDGIKFILNETKIGQNHNQMGILEYSDDVRKPLKLGQNQSRNTIEHASNGISYSGGFARHDLALKEIENMFADARTRREGIPRVAILIITKKSPDPMKTIEAAHIWIEILGLFGSCSYST